MDYNQQASKNFLWLIIAQVLVRILGVAFFVFLSYQLRQDGIGEYNFIGSFVPFWLLLVDFGAGDYLYREWTKQKETEEDIRKDFNILFSIRFFLSLIIFIPFIIINYRFNGQIFWSLVLFYLSLVLSTFIHVNDLYLQSKNLFKYTGIRQVLEKITSVVVGVTLLFIYKRLEMVFIAILLSQIISFGYYQVKKLSVPLRFIFDWHRSVNFMKRGLPFMFIILFASIYSRIDMIMLRYFDGFGAVGLYGAAYKFLDFSAIFAVLFISAIFPLLSKLYNDPSKAEEFRNFYNRSLRIIFSVSLVIVLFFIVFASQIITLIFPANFDASILALRILMIAQILMFLSLFFSNLLVVQTREKRALTIIIISASINIILNLVLIPRYSLYGAAWATVIAEAINLFMLQKNVEWQINRSLVSKMVTIVVINVFILLGLKFYGQLNNLFLGVSVLAFNLFILFKLRLTRREDLILFISPIKNKLLSFGWNLGKEDL